jgi:outer membrane protein TolC
LSGRREGDGTKSAQRMQQAESETVTFVQRQEQNKVGGSFTSLVSESLATTTYSPSSGVRMTPPSRSWLVEPLRCAADRAQAAHRQVLHHAHRVSNATAHARKAESMYRVSSSSSIPPRNASWRVFRGAAHGSHKDRIGPVT